MEFKYPSELEESQDTESTLSRRHLLKSAAAIVGGGAASLLGAPALAQGPNPAAIAAAEAQRQASGKTAGMKFRALVRHGNDLSNETLTLRPIHPQQVVIRNQAAQTCYTTTGALNTTNRPPNANVAGHGGVGVVEEIGSQVKRVQVGDQVVMSITPHCGACANCLNGRADICSMFGRPLIPSASMSDGTAVMMANGPSGYAEYLVTWEEFIVPVFTKVPPVELSLLACVSACGLGLAMCRFPVEAGSDVVVFGLGPVGMSAVQGARIQGAARIIGIDPITYRRDLALKLGATTVLNPNVDKGNDLLTRIRSLTADVVPTGRFFTGQRAAGPMYVLEAVGGTRFPLPAGVEAPADMTGVEALQQSYAVVRGGGYVRTCSVGHPIGRDGLLPGGPMVEQQQDARAGQLRRRAGAARHPALRQVDRKGTVRCEVDDRPGVSGRQDARRASGCCRSVGHHVGHSVQHLECTSEQLIEIIGFM
jgi:S-(hydroxymethyl)glutathione dehydrogenase/alcohol dehydrogenase